MSQGIALEHVLARNLRELIAERSVAHGSLSAWMRAIGLDWTPNRLSQTLTFRRTLTLAELAGLCLLLEVPLSRFLAGDGDVLLPGGTVAPLAAVRSVLMTGANPEGPTEGFGWGHGESVVAVRADDPIEADVARKLDVDVQVVRVLALRLFGDTHVSVERDRRAGDLSGVSDKAARAKRGHATRAVIADMRAALPDLLAGKLQGKRGGQVSGRTRLVPTGPVIRRETS